MTVPLGNTPAPSSTPDELQTQALVWYGNAAKRGEPPVIVFYRTVDFPAEFAPKPNNIDPQTGRPKLVHPVTVDLYFPNGPLAGRVYRRVGFINAGITGPVRATAIGSINVGQLGCGQGQNGDYPQLNALDSDALAWASQIHQAAGGDVFAYYGGGPSEPVAATQPEPVADRYAGMPVPQPGQAAQSAAATPAPAPSGPPPGVPGGAPAGVPAQPAAPQGPPPGVPGQPAPTGMAPPPGVPGLGAPPAGVPAASGGAVGAPPV